MGAAMAGVALIGELGDLNDYENVIRPILGVVAGLALGVLAYSAAFMWLGLISGQALGLAIVYVFVWEGAAANIFSGIRYLSIRSYSLITMREAGGSTLYEISPVAGAEIGVAVALGGAAAIVIAFLALTLIQLKNMDVP